MEKFVAFTLNESNIMICFLRFIPMLYGKQNSFSQKPNNKDKFIKFTIV
jgi:hypothetical protein